MGRDLYIRSISSSIDALLAMTWGDREVSNEKSLPPLEINSEKIKIKTTIKSNLDSLFML